MITGSRLAWAMSESQTGKAKKQTITAIQTRDVAWLWAECLFSTHKPRVQFLVLRKPRVVVLACNPSTQEGKGGQSFKVILGSRPVGMLETVPQTPTATTNSIVIIPTADETESQGPAPCPARLFSAVTVDAPAHFSGQFCSPRTELS